MTVSDTAALKESISRRYRFSIVDYVFISRVLRKCVQGCVALHSLPVLTLELVAMPANRTAM